MSGLPAIDYDDFEPETERYPSAPPISAIRAIIRDEDETLRCAVDPPPRLWPIHCLRLSATCVLVALSAGLPWLPTVGVLSSTLILVLLARRS